ncbi:hypothetical protein SKAU_G00359860 [Synaphobranchus kaupii]|uniref:Uncharacterized protein n=1 Tax=Synaphobranchus kaupii TaxID=118154 RepID=A0A9Q1EI56_SYNKA|nr:hypothetical protein SKAU_G00359860 [Synaphobranchus kaupii]
MDKRDSQQRICKPADRKSLTQVGNESWDEQSEPPPLADFRRARRRDRAGPSLFPPGHPSTVELRPARDEDLGELVYGTVQPDEDLMCVLKRLKCPEPAKKGAAAKPRPVTS